MPRSYRHISQYEDEIIELRSQGITKRKICEKYDFTMKQLTNFITRYNEMFFAPFLSIKKGSACTARVQQAK